MIGTLELITPAIAQAMLAANVRNRHIVKSLVHRYAEEMRAGRWNANGQGIVLTPDGELLDGQHRLEAIVESGVSLEMFVVRGVPKERFETMDSGRARTTGDVLGANGYPHYNQLAAIARIAWNYVSGVSVGYGPSRVALIEFVRNHPYLNDVTARVVNANTPIPNSQLGGVLFVANAGHHRLDDHAAAFLQGLATGANLAKNDPRLTLREWVFNQRARTAHGISPENAFVAVARAWNAFAQDRELAVIKLIKTPTRKTLPIFDYDAAHFADVEDIAARNLAIATANLNLTPVRGRKVS